MKKEYDVLFSPARIGTCELKNRFVMCPMAGTTMLEWIKGEGLDPEVHDLFIDRAKDGIGLLIPGAVSLYSFNGRQWLWQHPEAFDGVQNLMDEIHGYGSKVFFNCQQALDGILP